MRRGEPPRARHHAAATVRAACPSARPEPSKQTPMRSTRSMRALSTHSQAKRHEVSAGHGRAARSASLSATRSGMRGRSAVASLPAAPTTYRALGLVAVSAWAMASATSSGALAVLVGAVQALAKRRQPLAIASHPRRVRLQRARRGTPIALDQIGVEIALGSIRITSMPSGSSSWRQTSADGLDGELRRVVGAGELRGEDPSDRADEDDAPRRPGASAAAAPGSSRPARSR